MKRIKIIASLILVSAAIFVVWLCATSGVYYKTYSPDRQYAVYAEKYNWQRIIPAMPGAGGDASGKVFLYDEMEHRIIGKAGIAMISMTTDIKWDETQAYFMGDDYPNVLKPWTLPRRIKLSAGNN